MCAESPRGDSGCRTGLLVRISRLCRQCEPAVPRVSCHYAAGVQPLWPRCASTVPLVAIFLCHWCASCSVRLVTVLLLCCQGPLEMPATLSTLWPNVRPQQRATGSSCGGSRGRNRWLECCSRGRGSSWRILAEGPSSVWLQSTETGRGGEAGKKGEVETRMG